MLVAGLLVAVWFVVWLVSRDRDLAVILWAFAWRIGVLVGIALVGSWFFGVFGAGLSFGVLVVMVLAASNSHTAG